MSVRGQAEHSESAFERVELACADLALNEMVWDINRDIELEIVQSNQRSQMVDLKLLSLSL
jgi:hypothetical protein